MMPPGSDTPPAGRISHHDPSLRLVSLTFSALASCVFVCFGQCVE